MSVWDNEKNVEMLKKLWAEGLSATEIAGRLGGVSRSSVIGKVWRLGLPERAKDSRHRRCYGRGTKKKQAAPGQDARLVRTAETQPLHIAKKFHAYPVPDPRQDDIPTKTFDELEWNDGCCRWRVDKSYKNRPYGFCAKETLPGLTFCEGHARRAYANWPEVKHKYVKPVEAREKEAV